MHPVSLQQDPSWKTPLGSPPYTISPAIRSFLTRCSVALNIATTYGVQAPGPREPPTVPNPLNIAWLSQNISPTAFASHLPSAHPHSAPPYPHTHKGHWHPSPILKPLLSVTAATMGTSFHSSMVTPDLPHSSLTDQSTIHLIDRVSSQNPAPAMALLRLETWIRSHSLQKKNK